VNEAHGQNYNAEQFMGGIDEEEIRIAVHDGLRSLRSIAKSLEALATVIGTDDLGRASVRVTGEFIGGDGDVTAGV
jgi:hypothetical protein